MRRFRVGVIGAGHIAEEYHFGALAQLPDVELAVVMNRGLAKARQAAEKYGAGCATDDLEVALRADLDGVIVATPDDTHRDIAIRAIDAGIAVLLQKPVTVTMADALDLVHARRTARLPVAVAFMHRYLDETLAMRRLLRSGRIGDVMSVRVRNATPGAYAEWFYRRPTSGPGGVVPQLGVHGIDLVLHLFGDIRSAQAMVCQRVPVRTVEDGTIVSSDVPDHAMAIYRLANGTLVTHEMCWAEAAGTDRFRLEVYGTKATAWMRYPSEGVVVVERGADGAMIEDRLRCEQLPLGVRHHRTWVDDARAGTDDGTLADAVRGLAVMAAVQASSDTGRRIDL